MDTTSSEIKEPLSAHIEFIPIGRTERRGARRQQVNELASLNTKVNAPPITCLVHNLSDTGAMIETSVKELPQRFILDNPTRNMRTLCRVVWSCQGLTGVEFIKSDKLQS